MNLQEKFYTDAKRCIKRAQTASQATEDIVTFFCDTSGDMKAILESLACYWKTRYAAQYNNSSRPESRYELEKHIQWLSDVLDLLDGSFGSEQDFPKADWLEIRDCINAEAGDMDIDRLTSILSILTERKVL